MYMWFIWKYICFWYLIKLFLDLFKIIADAELIYNLSGLANCDILHLLRYYWGNMALIHILHLHVILFLLLTSFIYFCMYFWSDVSPIQFFRLSVLASKKPPSELSNIVSLCISRIGIWNFFLVSLPEYK